MAIVPAGARRCWSSPEPTQGSLCVAAGLWRARPPGTTPIHTKEHPVIKMRVTDVLSVFPLMYLPLLVAIPDRAFGEGGSAGMPEHASAERYGGGWTCDRGFRASEDACVPIQVPANGYLTDAQYGSGWTCDRGYRAVKDACVALEIPDNAHLDSSGNDWDCNEPYRKRDGKCTLM